MKALISLLVFAFGLSWGQPHVPPASVELSGKKIGGVSLVPPQNEISADWVTPIQQMNAEWVAFLPYAYSRNRKPEVHYDREEQTWGERMVGLRKLIQQAKSKGMKVMLKPMVWVFGSWPGGFYLKSEVLWKEWESNYSQFIGELARMSEEEGVDLLCIGTEFKMASQLRESYWRKLIRDTRKIYHGSITYAANWDEFEAVRFWDELDYIGVDAYFPLSTSKTATVKQLKSRWKFPAMSVMDVQKKYQKKVIFTEFGYRSMDGCTWNQWELENIAYDQKVNLQAQMNAYQTFFEYFWDREWFAGMFVWQWYTDHQHAGGEGNSDYTPQNKPAEQLISTWFGRE